MIYTTNQFAYKINISKKTLYAWLKKGWLKEPERDYKNHRVWTEENLKEAMQFKNQRFSGKEK